VLLDDDDSDVWLVDVDELELEDVPSELVLLDDRLLVELLLELEDDDKLLCEVLELDDDVPSELVLLELLRDVRLVLLELDDDDRLV
jgi:hypothetical protein